MKQMSFILFVVFVILLICTVLQEFGRGKIESLTIGCHVVIKGHDHHYTKEVVVEKDPSNTYFITETGAKYTIFDIVVGNVIIE